MASVDSVIGKARAILRKCNEYTGEVSHDIWHAVQAVIDKSAGKIDPPTDVIEFNENGEYDVVNYGTAIVDVQGGIDVSDTTATASDVLSGKVFHTSDGASTSGELVIKQVTPSLSPAWAEGYIEIMNAGYGKGGYIIPTWGSTTPSSSGTAFGAGFRKMTSAGYAVIKTTDNAIVPSTSGASFYTGWNYMNTSGYAYSSQPSGGKSGTFTTTSSGTSVSCGFTPTKVLVYSNPSSAGTYMHCDIYWEGTTCYIRTGGSKTACATGTDKTITPSTTGFTHKVMQSGAAGYTAYYIAMP